MNRLYILTLVSIVLSFTIYSMKKRNPSTIASGKGLVIKKEWLAINKNPLTPEKDRRPADQTFLTFPEWYLVFSPAEQADYFKHTTATSFPFMKHTAQIWQSYKIVKEQIKDNFPVNRGYHFMIWVIGSSATVEYSMKALYETLVGRLTDTKSVVTEEDKFNAVYTQDYVDFIRDRPWYEFDFKKRLKYLWSNVPVTGQHFIRKIERRYMLTTELLVKWGYGKLIGLGTKTVYDEALMTTAVNITSLPENLHISQSTSPVMNDTALIYLPRYDKFSTAALKLAREGFAFKEIAGNNSAILVTVMIPVAGTHSFGNAQIVFIQPVASNLSMQRVAMAIPVAQLHTLLLQLDKDGVKVEHVFDY